METSSQAPVLNNGGGNGRAVTELTRRTHFLAFSGQNDAHPLGTIFNSLLGLLSEQEWAARFLNTAEGQGYKVEISSDEGNDIYIDHQRRVLSLPGQGLKPAAIARSMYFSHEFQINVIKGLRQIDQIERGVTPPYLQPDQALMMARLLCADQAAVMLIILHDLKDTCPDLWRHALGSDYGDMAALWGQNTNNRKDDLNRAILSWFKDPERVASCDRAALAQIDFMMQETKTPKLYRAQLTDAMIARVCHDTSGHAYLGKATASTLYRLFNQPLADPINAHYLAQIMRERDITMVNNVGFRDPDLARAIFPDQTQRS